MINELIQRVFVTRNATHMAHWRTKKYAQHKALGMLYDGIVDDLDAIVEAYMGAYGEVVEDIEIPKTPKVKDILKHLAEEANWIEENHEEICQGVSAIGNLIDNLTARYLSTMYKLKQLS